MTSADHSQALPHLAARKVSTVRLSEWSFVLGVTLAIVAFTSLPYIYATLSAPPGRQFMGILIDVPDHTQYFAWMRDLARASLIENKLTPEPNRAIFFNLLWWGLGRLGLWLGVGYAGMFQVLRVLAAGLFLPLVYRVISFFIAPPDQRRTAFLVAVLTSGLGWVLVVLKYLLHQPDLAFPMDAYIAEGNTFFGVMAYPHFIAAALYIAVFDLLLRGEVKHQYRYAWAAGMVALFLGWQHAYDLISVYGVIGAYALARLVRDRRIPWFWTVSALIVAVISAWPALYSLWLTTADPVWRQVLDQFGNAGVFTPGLLHLPILFGLTLLLALAAVIRGNPFRLKQKSDADLFLLAWFLVTFLLIYLPVDYQMHLMNGWQIPMAILAVQGLARYGVPWLQQIVRRLVSPHKAFQLLSVALVLAVIPTNLYLWAWRLVDLNRHTYPYYLSTDELAAIKWLERQGTPEDVVLSSETTGQFIPMLTGKHAFLAHWAQTLDYFGKRQAVAQFFSSGGSTDERLALLAQYQVRYILVGPAERQLGDGPGDIPGLSAAFSSGAVTIYAVQAGGEPAP